MSLKDKYQPVIDLMNELKVKNKEVKEERGTLIINGEVDEPGKRKLILNKIHCVNRENALDVLPKINLDTSLPG